MQAQAAPPVKELRDLWRQVSRQHLAMGGACGCGFGFSIGVGDLEADICDFLAGKLENEAASGAQQVLKRMQENAPLSINSVLTLIENEADAATSKLLRSQLAMSLGSFAQAHGRNGFICD